MSAYTSVCNYIVHRYIFTCDSSQPTKKATGFDIALLHLVSSRCISKEEHLGSELAFKTVIRRSIFVSQLFFVSTLDPIMIPSSFSGFKAAL